MMTTNKIEEEEEKPNPGPGPGADRISELPKEILHRILGFLEMDELLIQTSLVSTKWRNLWKSVPVLTFSSRGAFGLGEKHYYNFVDNVLRFRESKIQIFNCSFYYSSLEHLHNFIVSAAEIHGAAEIQIRCYYFARNNNNVIHFNPSIFKSGGLLKKFTFNVLTSDFIFQFPRSMCCCATTQQLTHLSLAGIRLPEGDDESNAQLHLVCPVLETLVMRCCNSKHLKVLDISAPRLKTLSIFNIRILMGFGGSDFLGQCRLEIRTPNLTSLNYSGCVYVDCFTDNLRRVADASLQISKERPGMKTTSFAIKLLKGLTTAETLTLAGFEVLSQDTSKVLLKKFTSLRTLELKSNCKISSIHGMMHILNSCNSIEKFAWEVDEYVEVEGDEHSMLSQCRLSDLKHVHIKRLHGHENEIEFVKFLLKSSVVLEDLIINTTKNSPKQTIEENLKQFIEEEPSFSGLGVSNYRSFRRNPGKLGDRQHVVFDYLCCMRSFRIT